MDMWDLFQQKQIDDATEKADQVRDTAERTEHRLQNEIRRLDGKIEGLALVCQALWELLRQHSNLSDADVKAKMDEIDLRDGRLDGRITGQPYDCPACNRPVHSHHSACIWCKAKLTPGVVVKTDV